MTPRIYVYVVYMMHADRPLFVGAFENHEEAIWWCGDDIAKYTIAQVFVVRSDPKKAN